MKQLTGSINVEDKLIGHNQLTVNELFELYRSLNFIYPEKWERLKPVFQFITNTWTRAIKLDFPLFWVSTIIENKSNIISTGTSWQYLNTGMIAQHLASNNPMGSRIIFLGMLNRMMENQDRGLSESYQVYYRPQNKFSCRLFEPLSIMAGEDLSVIIPYNYCEVPFLKEDSSANVVVKEVCHAAESGFLNFLIQQRGELFVKTQELNSADITLQKLNGRFNAFGLHRERKIFMAFSPHAAKIYGVIIVNQSSLGFNFSFFENSSELILGKEIPIEFQMETARKLIQKASELYTVSHLDYIPLLIDPIHSHVIPNLNGRITRDYNLFIMRRGGYEIWYEYMDRLTKTVSQRFINKVYAKPVAS